MLSIKKSISENFSFTFDGSSKTQFLYFLFFYFDDFLTSFAKKSYEKNHPIL